MSALQLFVAGQCALLSCAVTTCALRLCADPAAEGSKTQGYMVQDMFHLTRNVSIPVLFGCDQYETGAMYSQHVEGLIGMGNTAASLHAQVSARPVMASVLHVLECRWLDAGVAAMAQNACSTAPNSRLSALCIQL